MKIRFLVASALWVGASMLVSGSALAFSSSADFVTVNRGANLFSTTGYAVVGADDFDDGVIDPVLWVNPSGGTVSESGTTVTLSSPGAPINLGPGFTGETSFISGIFTDMTGTGEQTLFSSDWVSGAPTAIGDGYGISIAGLDLSGNVVRSSMNVIDVHPASAAALQGLGFTSAAPGLHAVFQTITSDPSGNVLSVDDYQNFPITAAEIAAGVNLSVVYGDALGMVQGGFTSSSGLVFSSPTPYGSSFVSTNLVATNVVPEPGTAMLMFLGLTGLAASGGRREARIR